MSVMDLMKAKEGEGRAKHDLEVSKRDLKLVRIERDRHQRESEAARQENERLRQQLERVQKELEEERQRGAPVDVQAIKDAYLIGWVDEWHASAEGLEWLEGSCRVAQLQGYQATLRYLGSRLPSSMSKDDLWGGMPKFDNVGIDDEGNVFFIEQEEGDADVGPSDLVISPWSPTSAAKDRLEVERLLDASDSDAVCLASRSSRTISKGGSARHRLGDRTAGGYFDN
ncbi:hypothetical protein Dimus_039470 [Dionaea muscipula]